MKHDLVYELLCGGSVTFLFFLFFVFFVLADYAITDKISIFALIIDFQAKLAHDQEPYSIYYKIAQESMQ